MMNFPITINVPLRHEDDGSIRVGKTRVLLEIVIRAFQRGDTPETIVENFPTLRLDDVYAILAYYLQQPTEIDAYMEQVKIEAKQIREKIEAKQPQIASIRERLRKRLADKTS